MSKLNQSKILFAAGAGTILEWYDFALFAYLTPLLAALFFPSDHPYTAMMLTYAIFAVGYFVRPLGAVLFGHLGDRIGRKKTLMWSILLMSIPTCLMGLLPTYQSIGIAAPILLVILRICQGLSAGGESTGAILFALESAPTARYRGLLGGLLWAVVGAGMLCGSFAATLVAQSEADWAWRVPFLAGILTGLIGYFVRARTVESLDFLRAIREKTLAKFPLWQGIVQYKKAMLAMIAFYCL
ncbi:MAG TPA: MFS transporter, partial [Gammaproteobacteria bacterium]|nr:MFS transporter [Gammaproteobacteria bacterium]